MVREWEVYTTKVYVTEEGFVFNDKNCTIPRRCIKEPLTGEWYIDFGMFIPIRVSTAVYYLFGALCNGVQVFERYGIIHKDGVVENNHVDNLQLPPLYDCRS